MTVAARPFLYLFCRRKRPFGDAPARSFIRTSQEVSSPSSASECFSSTTSTRNRQATCRLADRKVTKVKKGLSSQGTLLQQRIMHVKSAMVCGIICSAPHGPLSAFFKKPRRGVSPPKPLRSGRSLSRRIAVPLMHPHRPPGWTFRSRRRASALWMTQARSFDRTRLQDCLGNSGRTHIGLDNERHPRRPRPHRWRRTAGSGVGLRQSSRLVATPADQLPVENCSGRPVTHDSVIGDRPIQSSNDASRPGGGPVHRITESVIWSEQPGLCHATSPWRPLWRRWRRRDSRSLSARRSTWPFPFGVGGRRAGVEWPRKGAVRPPPPFATSYLSRHPAVQPASSWLAA